MTTATATTVVDDPTDTTGFDADQLAIWTEQVAIYGAFLAGDRPRIDRRIHPDATIWDAVTEAIARGLDDLNAIRATRPAAAAAPTVVHLGVADPIITVIGDAAIARHVLVVDEVAPDSDDSAGARTREVMRVSAGWRRIDGDWWIVHSHEDLFSVTPID